MLKKEWQEKSRRQISWTVWKVKSGLLVFQELIQSIRKQNLIEDITVPFGLPFSVQKIKDMKRRNIKSLNIHISTAIENRIFLPGTRNIWSLILVDDWKQRFPFLFFLSYFLFPWAFPLEPLTSWIFESLPLNPYFFGLPALSFEHIFALVLYPLSLFPDPRSLIPDPYFYIDVTWYFCLLIRLN